DGTSGCRRTSKASSLKGCPPASEYVKTRHIPTPPWPSRTDSLAPAVAEAQTAVNTSRVTASVTGSARVGSSALRAPRRRRLADTSRHPHHQPTQTGNETTPQTEQHGYRKAGMYLAVRLHDKEMDSDEKADEHASEPEQLAANEIKGRDLLLRRKPVVTVGN